MILDMKKDQNNFNVQRLSKARHPYLISYIWGMIGGLKIRYTNIHEASRVGDTRSTWHPNAYYK